MVLRIFADVRVIGLVFPSRMALISCCLLDSSTFRTAPCPSLPSVLHCEKQISSSALRCEKQVRVVWWGGRVGAVVALWHCCSGSVGRGLVRQSTSMVLQIFADVRTRAYLRQEPASK